MGSMDESSTTESAAGQPSLVRRTGPLWALRRVYFRVRLRWQYRVGPRMGSLTWLAPRLSWPIWCRLCATDAETTVREVGRRAGRPLRFLQIGANDGVSNDPLSATVRTYGWSGVLVEPLPRMMERLIANYADVAGLRFANAAIGTREGTLTFYTVEGRPGEPAWADQISSLDRDFVLGHAHALEDLENRIVPIEVECLPLRSLVARYELDALDLLHVDAEGLDFEIVNQVPVDASWAPHFLTFEIKHMGLERWKMVKARLRRGGYKFVNVWPDAFAYRSAPERMGRGAANR